jgi:hypothetical protein
MYDTTTANIGKRGDRAYNQHPVFDSSFTSVDNVSLRKPRLPYRQTVGQHAESVFKHICFLPTRNAITKKQKSLVYPPQKTQHYEMD